MRQALFPCVRRKLSLMAKWAERNKSMSANIAYLHDEQAVAPEILSQMRIVASMNFQLVGFPVAAEPKTALRA